ncbi:UNVERIFIED_CONTAM: cytochrome [Sesamum radiatum]|uniref:Cytochrome n=1 Tax=Sesamum radiatum TaxID=300843 RepID=A0AAW2V850_SESRA
MANHMDFLLSPTKSVATTLLYIIFSFLIVKLLSRKLQGKKKYHPIGGTVFNQLLNFYRLHDYMADLAVKYKTYRLIAPFRSEVYTSDPANVEHMLKTNFEKYGKGPYNCGILGDLFGDGIFAVDGHKWREQRKVSSLEFSTRVLRDYSSVVFRKNALRLAKILSGAATSNQPVDIQGPYNCGILGDLFGDGIFAVDGHKWREQRKVSSLEFSTRVLRDYSSVVFRKNAVRLAKILSGAATSNQPVDIQDLLMKSTFDSISEVAIGVELDSLGGSNEEGAKFSVATDDVSMRTLWRYVDVLWKLKRALNVGSEAKLKKSLQVVDEFAYKLIHSRTQQMNMPGNDSVMRMKKDDLLSRFLQLTDATPKYLRDITMNFIIAGKDTTATTLSWFIYMLCKYPHVQEKVAEEIKDATGCKEVADISEFSACLTEEALGKMHYLHAALTETLRIYPAVAVDAKQCLRDDIMPDGFSVRKGDMVAYQPYAMGRMKSIWGNDAEEFKPERWLDKNGCFQHASPFKFTAFQAGLRLCLGKDFAYRQMKIFSSILLRFFTVKLSDERKAVKYRPMLTLVIDGGLIVRTFHRMDQKTA